MHTYPSSFDDVRPRLRLRIMSRTFTALHPLGAETSQGIANDRLACVPLAGDLDMCLVQDRGVSSTFLPLRWLETWRVRVEEALQLALDNRASQPSYRLTRQGKLWIYLSGNGYSLAELLVDKRRRGELPAAASLVALMPEENTLLVAPADDGPALRQTFMTALECAQRSRRPCSARPIELRNDEWQAFVPPEQFTLAYARLRRHIDFGHYAHQHEVLQAHLQRQRSRQVISRLVMARNPVTKERFLLTSCSRVEGLLVPEADVLVYIDEAKQEIHHMLWSEVMALAPSSMQRTDWWPPLWQVRELPDAPGLRKCASPAELFGMDGERPLRAQ